jgi:hypothetical protein
VVIISSEGQIIEYRDRRVHFFEISVCLQSHSHSYRELFRKIPATERNQRDVTSSSTVLQQYILVHDDVNTRRNDLMLLI